MRIQESRVLTGFGGFGQDWSDLAKSAGFSENKAIYRQNLGPEWGRLGSSWDPFGGRILPYFRTFSPSER